jgi:sugar phosphate isomerase/epimerase
MKSIAPLVFFSAVVASSMSAASAPDFRDHLGLQLWSVRVQSKESATGALDLAKSYGVKEVETAGTAGLPVEKFAAELKSRGLVAVSAHTGYAALQKDIGAAIAEAKALGAKFLICPYPKTDKEKIVSEEIAHQMAADFNRWGAACKAEGIRFGFHPHGLEFRPTAAGNGETVFDLLARETKPDLVCYEMDVFWVFHAGQDPAKLLAKYPTRWVLLHVKDIRKGAVTGLSSGSAPPTDNVTVGTGQINWPEVLRAAQKIGVQHYFLEDETPAPLQCIPDSLKYLRGLKL